MASELADLSLEDIIRKTKKGGGARRSAPARRNSSGGVARSGGIQKKRSAKSWGHDKFFEVYRGGKDRRGAAGSAAGKAICRLANVPYNVSQDELETLFEKYDLTKVALHYDFQGRSLGTAELHGSADVINRVNRDFKGVHIDGRALEITVVGGGGAASSPTLTRRITQKGGPVSARRSGGGGGASAKKSGPRKPQKPKMTAEELDKELDDYMQSSSKN